MNHLRALKKQEEREKEIESRTAAFHRRQVWERREQKDEAPRS